MFVYEKKLQYPVKIKTPNPALAKFIVSQYGGPDGELGASMRYLSQRYSMPYPELKGLLTDIGTEELGHLEMVAAVLHQLTREMTPEEIKRAGFDTYFVDHTAGVYPTAASGFPWTAASMQVKGDVIADLKKTCRPDDVQIQDGIAMVASVGRKMPSQPGVSGRLFAALGAAGVNIRTIAQGADELSITVGVSNEQFETAIRVLYHGFTG